MSSEDTEKLANFSMVKKRLEQEVQDSLSRGDTQAMIKAADRLKTFIEETKRSLELEVKECLERGDTEGMLRAADTMKVIVDKIDRFDQSDKRDKREAAKPSESEDVSSSVESLEKQPSKKDQSTDAPKKEEKKSRGVGGFLKMFFDTESFLEESVSQSTASSSEPAAKPASEPVPQEAVGEDTLVNFDGPLRAKELTRPSADLDPGDTLPMDATAIVESESSDDVKDEEVTSFEPDDSKEEIRSAEFQGWANQLSKKRVSQKSNLVSELISSLEESVDNCNLISEKLMSADHLIEGCKEAFSLLDCETEIVEEDNRTLRLKRDGQLLALLKVADDLNSPSRKELGELCIEITREWGKNGYEPKGIFLYNAFRRFELDSQEDFVDERTVDEEFTKMAEKNNICLLALEQLLFIVGSASVERVSSAKIIDKIVSSNGVVEAGEIHML